MSAAHIDTDVHRTVTTTKEVTPAPVMEAITWNQTIGPAVILTNVV